MDAPTHARVAHPTHHWHRLDDGRMCCEVCPHLCKLDEGEPGRCHVRARQGDELVSTTYGRVNGFCVAPIERAPLFHYHPGTPSLSLGTAGCNLFCGFCQVWESSQRRVAVDHAEHVTPEQVAVIASERHCRSVTFTYTEPLVALEFTRDSAIACRERGIATIVVTAGYACRQATADLFEEVSAVCVDLKAFSETFYLNECGGHLQPVLDTLTYLVRETNTWVEVNTMLIPGLNDSDTELHDMATWMVGELGAEVPWHFSAFRPDHQLVDRPPTRHDILERAREIALGHGVRYAYASRGREPGCMSTSCCGCGSTLITRIGHHICSYRLDGQGRCKSCGTRCPGVFDDAPGGWGAARVAVHPGDHVKRGD